jgi:hypothetical protein
LINSFLYKNDVCNIETKNIILIDKRDLKNIFVPNGVIIRDNLNVNGIGLGLAISDEVVQ